MRKADLSAWYKDSFIFIEHYRTALESSLSSWLKPCVGRSSRQRRKYHREGRKIKLVNIEWREREGSLWHLLREKNKVGWQKVECTASIKTRSLCQVTGYLGDRAGSTDICQNTEIKQKVMWERLQLSCGLKWCNCFWQIGGHSSHSLVPGLFPR